MKKIKLINYSVLQIFANKIKNIIITFLAINI
jgi:hypothetical protein